MYCYNGQCSYGGQCYGSPQLRYVDGKWCWMPIGSFKEDEISVMVFPSTKTQVQNKQELYDYCIRQAEKELAEAEK